MSGTWNRTLIYLGLREEPEEVYDELPERFVPEDDPYAEHAPPRTADPRGGAREHGRAVEIDITDASAASTDSNVRALRTGDVNVRPLKPAPLLRAAVVEVDTFEDVEAVGARYRTNQPVLFDASGADGATARRVVDFVSGLIFASRGRLTKVGRRAFLLLPDGLELPEDELRRLNDLGYRVTAGSGA